MSAFIDTRRAAFLSMVGLWGITLTYSGVAPVYGAIATSPEQVHELQRNAYMPLKPSTFSILREDYATFSAMGLTLREKIESGGTIYQIYAINDDPADATVDLRCTRAV